MSCFVFVFISTYCWYFVKYNNYTLLLLFSGCSFLAVRQCPPTHTHSKTKAKTQKPLCRSQEHSLHLLSGCLPCKFRPPYSAQTPMSFFPNQQSPQARPLFLPPGLYHSKLASSRACPVYFPSLGDHSSALPAKLCLEKIVSYILSGFLVFLIVVYFQYYFVLVSDVQHSG